MAEGGSRGLEELRSINDERERIREGEASPDSTSDRTERLDELVRLQAEVDRLRAEISASVGEDEATAEPHTEEPRPEAPAEELTPAQEKKGAFVALALDTEAVAGSIARDRAELEINRRQNERGFKGMMDRGYLRFFEEFSKRRLIKKYKKEIEIGYKEGDEDIRTEYQAVQERFAAEEADKLLHSGEKRELADEEFNGRAKELLKSYARGEINDEQFEEMRLDLVDDMATGNREVFLRRDAVTDNLFEMAKQLRVMVEHDQSLEQFDREFQMVIGRARGGLRSEAKLNAVDRAVQFLQKTPGLNLIAPETLAVVIGFGYSASAFGSQTAGRVASKAAFAFGGTALFGFVYGGIRRNKEVKTDRAMHERQRALGMEIAPGSKRREKMEQFRMETLSAVDATDRINELAAKGELSPEELTELWNRVSEMKARISVSDADDIDLISYTDLLKVQRERTALDIAIAKAEVMLAKNHPEGGISFDETMNRLITAQTEVFHSEMEDKEKAFRSYKRREVLKSAAIAAVIGGAVGWASHEVANLAFDHVDNGVSALKLSPIERLMMLARGETPMMGGGAEVTHKLSEKLALKLPKGVELIRHNDGSFSLFNPFDKENIASGLTFKNGQLTEESIAQLRGMGINVNDKVGFIEKTFSRTVHGTSPEDAIKGKHFGKFFERVYRNMWYDNDTPMYRCSKGHYHGSDLNELKLWWGGANNTGIDKNGNYVFDISHMMRKGSFHGRFRTDFLQDLQEGRLKLNMSMSEETQRQVASIKFNEHGQAIIPKDSPLAKIFFSTRNGHAVFKGRFAEVAEVVGHKNGHDVVNLLATEEGHGITRTPDVVEYFKRKIETHSYDFDIPREWRMIFPPLIPIFPRRPLERMAAPALVPYLGPNYFRSSAENRRLWEQERSPRLRRNPDAVLDEREELDYYLGLRESQRGAAYMQEIRTQAEATREAITPETKVVVVMPVASEHEAENIYNTLALYAEQNRSRLDTTAFLLNVNWIEGRRTDVTDRTLAEIERAKIDFPQLKIAYVTKEWSQEFVESREGVGIYGEVVSYLNDVAVSALDGANSTDTYLITSDADCQGLSTSYLDSIYRVIETHPEKDGVLGRIEWGTEYFDKFPGYHVTMRFMQIFDTVYRHQPVRESRNVASSGANFVVKTSTFAAVGGYNDKMGAGADKDLGDRIKAARFGGRRSIREEQYPIVYSNAAWLETDPQRGLAEYLGGRAVAGMWNDFDSGGYKPRGDEAETAPRENLEADFDEIASRIEFQLTELIKSYAGDRGRGQIDESELEIIEKTLSVAFPPQNGQASFRYSTSGKVTLTDSGRAWLLEQLLAYQREEKKEIKYRNGRGVRVARRTASAEANVNPESEPAEVAPVESAEESGDEELPAWQPEPPRTSPREPRRAERTPAIPTIEEAFAETGLLEGEMLEFPESAGGPREIIGIDWEEGRVLLDREIDGSPYVYIDNILRRRGYRGNARIQSYLSTLES